MKIYEFRQGQLKSSWANLEGLKYVSRLDPISGTLRDFYPPPGEVSFQWQDTAKSRPDVINPPGAPPIVSDKVKQFCVEMGFSGIEFFPAHPIAPYSRARVPKPDNGDANGVWWVMAPAVRYFFDEMAYCGPDATLCRETGQVIRDGKAISHLRYPGLIVLNEEPQHDFWGNHYAYLNDLYCGESVASTLIKQKFKNLELKECGFTSSHE